jgi:hypothetical protein
MSTNLVRITIPKKVKTLNQPLKPAGEQMAQTYKKEVKKFLPPNSKSLKVDTKFKSRLSKENIENDKNFGNVKPQDISKKLNFEKQLQANPSKANIGFQRIPSGKISNLKERNKLNSNTSRKDIEMRNQTFDSIHMEDCVSVNFDKKDKMDIDRKYETSNNFSLNNSKFTETRDTINNVADEKKSYHTLGNFAEDVETSIDIDEFINRAGKRLEEAGKLLPNEMTINVSKKEDEQINYLESLNEKNLRINFECKPEFQTEEYRNLVSQLLKRDYSNIIIKNLIKDEDIIEDCLANHKITERMRTRMVDWMIEVLSNYKCEDYTFFLAVNLMDRHFKASTKILHPNDLHSIGIAAMFMASKFYDVYPLRLKIVYEKIAHKKMSCDEIKNQETEIANSLNYVIGKPSAWEFINFYIDELFFLKENSYNLKNKTLLSYIKFDEGSMNCDFPFHLYTENMIKLLRLVVIYLAKMNCHDYNLINKKPSLLASSTLFVGLKICEQINKESYVNEYFFRKITEVSKKSQSEIIKCAQKILYNAQNFDSIFTGLDNLKKIHFNAIIEVKETK